MLLLLGRPQGFGEHAARARLRAIMESGAVLQREPLTEFIRVERARMDFDLHPSTSGDALRGVKDELDQMILAYGKRTQPYQSKVYSSAPRRSYRAIFSSASSAT